MVVLPISAAILSLTKITPAEAGGCPIVFDLDGDGQIKTTGLGNGRHKFFSAVTMLSTIQFDLEGTGSKQNIEWITGDGDGFLIDKSKWKTDGTMSGDALFGTAGGFRDGFEKLSKFDKNGDGIISGVELEELAFWQDNGDAVPQPEEYKDISAFGITEIPYRDVLESEKRGAPSDYTTYASTKDGTMLVEDIWLLETNILPSWQQRTIVLLKALIAI
jgi:hypothetical protein